MDGLRASVLAIRFLCELGILAGLAYWGFTVGEGASAWVLGLGAPTLAAIVWGTVVSPKARWPLSLPLRLSVEVDLYVIAGLALWFAQARPAALALVSLGVGTSVLNAVAQTLGPREDAGS